MRHPLDPLHLFHAAQKLGEVVGAGLMEEGEAAEAVVQWARDGAASALHQSGLQMRLMHRMRDAAGAVQARRERAEMAIRWAVRPLFAARASAAAIEEAAGKANGEVFAWEEVARVLRDELARARGRMRA
jgi:hypothetical protein